MRDGFRRNLGRQTGGAGVSGGCQAVDMAATMKTRWIVEESAARTGRHRERTRRNIEITRSNDDLFTQFKPRCCRHLRLTSTY